ncbi:MAG: DUF2490 domain-containing protein [Chitinophagaceae bacterium]|nr:DUF2490 domain-containing protein [Chitinophagaceae bacterium]
MRSRAVVFLLFISFSAQAQSFDLGSWNILNLKYNHTDHLSFFGEAQLRSLLFYHHFHYYEYKGGITYKIEKNVQLGLGMGSYQTYREGGNFVKPKNNNEFRIWPQIILVQPVKKLKVEQRYRSEMRFTSNGYRNRFRYRLGLSHPFGQKKNKKQPYQFIFGNEIFFTDREPYFERNRVSAIVGIRTGQFTTLQIGYLHQFDYRINDETGRDFLVIGFFIELSGKRYGQQGFETNIKDN